MGLELLGQQGKQALSQVLFANLLRNRQILVSSGTGSVRDKPKNR